MSPQLNIIQTAYHSNFSIEIDPRDNRFKDSFFRQHIQPVVGDEFDEMLGTYTHELFDLYNVHEMIDSIRVRALSELDTGVGICKCCNAYKKRYINI